MPDRPFYLAEGGGSAGDFYSVDINEEFQGDTLIGNTGHSVGGLAFDPTTGILYATTGNTGPATIRALYTMDPATGAMTLIGGHGIGKAMTDIAIDSAGNLFGYSAGNNPQLHSINKATGAATPIGSALTGENGGSCEFRYDVLYYIPSIEGNSIRSVNTVTGATVELAPLTDVFSSNSASFNPDDRRMYLTPGSGQIYWVNLSTGLVIFVKTSNGDGDAIAWEHFADDPNEPIPATVRLHDPPVERFILTSPARRTLAILDRRTTNRQATFVLNGPSSHSGLVASDDPEINIPFPDADDPAYLSNNTRFIYWLRREDTAFPPYVCRGAWIVMQVDDAAGDAPQTRYTAYDPWMLLFKRPVRGFGGELPGEPGLTFKAGTWRASDIAISLISSTVAVDGDVYIADYDYDQDDVMLTEDVNFEQGANVGEALQRLTGMGTIDIMFRPRYDSPGDLADIVIRSTDPADDRIGSLREEAVFGWDKPGKNVTEFSRLIDGTELANKVVVFTGQAGHRATTQTNAASVTKYGQYWAQIFATGTKPAQIVAANLLALAELELRKNGQRTITWTPAPERSLMVLRDYGLGDYVALWGSRNAREPIGIDYDTFDPDYPGASGYQRIYGITIEFDDNGVERVGPLLTSPDTVVGG